MAFFLFVLSVRAGREGDRRGDNTRENFSLIFLSHPILFAKPHVLNRRKVTSYRLMPIVLHNHERQGQDPFPLSRRGDWLSTPASSKRPPVQSTSIPAWRV
ncbi:uncharacterized protein SCHCODRAFT_02621125 [Schizophyllum commune H4-8]|uniref:uncharacterized protein n=1 Tax=Schizophyllum commune (strain H4-8 / FGSC 9210) TaxID=578458 RepID=UPI00215E0C67|nr:uncharacterized protein SCHCODRAFT_02621125 [Schizophyllum commune H4-8]KAI5893199.1 hypothetical protein SCHCODRAFT_02621125 [Schizophyllum commune H4-8]